MQEAKSISRKSGLQYVPFSRENNSPRRVRTQSVRHRGKRPKKNATIKPNRFCNIKCQLNDLNGIDIELMINNDKFGMDIYTLIDKLYIIATPFLDLFKHSLVFSEKTTPGEFAYTLIECINDGINGEFVWGINTDGEIIGQRNYPSDLIEHGHGIELKWTENLSDNLRLLVWDVLKSTSNNFGMELFCHSDWAEDHYFGGLEYYDEEGFDAEFIDFVKNGLANYQSGPASKMVKYLCSEEKIDLKQLEKRISEFTPNNDKETKIINWCKYGLQFSYCGKTLKEYTSHYNIESEDNEEYGLNPIELCSAYYIVDEDECSIFKFVQDHTQSLYENYETLGFCIQEELDENCMVSELDDIPIKFCNWLDSTWELY